MRKIILPTLLLLLFSCSNPMDKKYDSKTYAADLKEIETNISESEKSLLNNWVLKHNVSGREIELNGLTYQQILEDAKKEVKEKEDKLNKFYNTKFINDEIFIQDTQKLIDKGILKISVDEIGCIGFFCSYKQREGTINNYTYNQIFKEAPKFCEEKGYSK